jgi:glycosyltransferase involved in cell wall biosynthesis
MGAFVKPDISYFKANGKTENAIFSILIPSWNNLDFLKLCVDSLKKNSSYQHQIIIHVNEGTDGTLNWVKENGYDYTFSAKNAGVCHAVNASAKLATTDYIVYFNDDMYACPCWDSILYEAIHQRKSHLFYYSGTMIEFEKGSNLTTLAPYDFGSEISTFNEEALLSFCKTFSGKEDWFGACWPPSIVHKSLWDAVGGYSEDYSPGFYSDPDFAMKLWNAGVRDFRGFGKSLVYHFKCKSTGRVEKNDGRTLFMKTWGFPSSYFYKNVLKMGQPYDALKPLTFKKGLLYNLSALKSLLK